MKTLTDTTRPPGARQSWRRPLGMAALSASATAMAASGVLLTLPALTQTAFAQASAPASKARKTTRPEPVTLNFVNAEIEGVARAMAVILKQQFVVDPRVKGSITLYSETPISPQEAYLNFLTALRGLGFSVVEVAGIQKIVPEADAKLQSATVEVGDANRRGDVVVTQIFKLNHENPNNLVAILRPLISPNNIINANPGNNTLVITDYADNLARLGKIIAALDTAGASDLEIIPIQHAAASDVATLLQRLNEGGGTPGAQAMPGSGHTVVVDPRNNSLIVRAPNAVRMASLKAMIAKLDRPAPGSGANGNIWVVYLKNADAAKLATVLRAAFAVNQVGSGSAGAGGGAGGGASPSPSGSGEKPPSPMGIGGNASGASAQATAPTTPGAGPSTGGFIQADPSTNSLIITAPEPMYRQLRAVIDQLDGRRAQVYIESMIVKIDASKELNFGIQWQGISGKYGDSVLRAGGTNFNTGGGANIIGLSADILQGVAGAAAAAAKIPAGLNIGVANRIYTNSDGTPIYTLGALASFLEANAAGNVLSTPNLIALDNEEAKIVIGQNVPFITGSYANNGSNPGTVNPYQTIERKDVGLTLRVKPQIGEGGNVRMTIFQENSAVVSTSSTAGPTTDKSSIETSVTVDDGQILVLGGLLKEEVTDEVGKVPLLGDIPILGALFRSEGKKRGKSNLMVFLRPVVIRDQAGSDAISLDRYESIKARLPSMDSMEQFKPKAAPAPQGSEAGKPPAP
jgi:general secretion pathway protein D